MFGIIFNDVLDLRKAFDTIKFLPLFAALRRQGVPEAYVQLLGALYEKLKGTVNGSSFFDILRGVKQGDVLSSMLFNAGLQEAFREWHCQLSTEDFLFSMKATRLANVRYADDIMLFGKTIDELSTMLERLVEAFGRVGLELNASKTKILTNDNIEYQVLDVIESMVEIVQPEASHKYLGRYLPGEFTFRQNVEVNHRIKCGWYAFGRHSAILCNRNVSVKLRLRLFDAVVTPTILFGLAVLPLSQVSLNKIEVVQRKMLRKIAGWVRIGNEPWEETMRRMKDRVSCALQQYPVMPWKKRIGKALWKFILRVKTAPENSWIQQSSMWAPNEMNDDASDFLPYRCRGRPCLKWDSVVREFCLLHYGESWQKLSIDILSRCTEAFVEYFHNCDNDVERD